MENQKVDIVRAWKDEEYRKNLTPEQLKELPSNPAGEVELDEEELNNVSGGVCVTSRNPLIKNQV